MVSELKVRVVEMCRWCWWWGGVGRDGVVWWMSGVRRRGVALSVQRLMAQLRCDDRMIEMSVL